MGASALSGLRRYRLGAPTMSGEDIDGWATIGAQTDRIEFLRRYWPDLVRRIERERAMRRVSPARLYDALWLLKRARFGDDEEFPTLPEVRLALDAAMEVSDDTD